MGIVGGVPSGHSIPRGNGNGSISAIRVVIKTGLSNGGKVTHAPSRRARQCDRISGTGCHVSALVRRPLAVEGDALDPRHPQYFTHEMSFREGARIVLTRLLQRNGTFHLCSDGFPIQQRRQFLTGFKCSDLLRWNSDRLTCTRVASLPGLRLSNLERTEAAQINLLALLERVCHGLKDRIEKAFARLLTLIKLLG